MIKTFTKAFVGTVICAMSLSATAAVIPAETVIEMDAPAESVVNKSTCYGAVLGHPFGMAAVSLKCAKGVKVDETSPLLVSLYYGDTLLKSIGTVPDEDDGSGITHSGFGGLDDQGLIEWDSQNIWLLMFNFMAPPQYWRYGEYRVEIPEGVFVLDDDVVGAMTLNYVFEEEAEETLGYTVTPEDGTEFTPLEPIKSVTLTVTGTEKDILDYSSRPADWSGLYNPAGERLGFASSYPNIDGRNITWNFIEKAAAPVEWVDGVYTFRVLKGKLFIGQYASGDYDEVGNFPEEDIEIGYVIKDGSTAVTMVGAGACDSYTIHTLDGVKVLDKGTADDLLQLPAGVYVINGKQTVLRR